MEIFKLVLSLIQLATPIALAVESAVGKGQPGAAKKSAVKQVLASTGALASLPATVSATAAAGDVSGPPDILDYAIDSAVAIATSNGSLAAARKNAPVADVPKPDGPQS